VTLPAANRTLVAAPVDEGDNGSDHEVPADLRVLIIDDDPSVARALTRVLGRHDFTLIDNGKQAIDLLARGDRFDLVFCDLMMPNTSGMEVYKAVRQLTPGRERDLIFITGGAFTPEAESFLSTVPNVVLHKPFERETVIDALKRQLGRRPA
jgi:CheY-like chemotaxis protein